MLIEVVIVNFQAQKVVSAAAYNNCNRRIGPPVSCFLSGIDCGRSHKPQYREGVAP
jgi:hypothetical protein